MGFISGLIDVVDHLGRRLITPNSLGRYQPVRLKLWPGASTTCVDRGDGTSELQIAAPSDVLSYATAADFRAATPPADGTFFRVVSPAGEYRYSTSSGAGWADDNDTILKPNSVLIGSNGRAFSTRASAHAATFTAARSMKGLVVSGIRHVHIESHTTFGDGGGGVFDVRDASVDPDDDGTVIQATAGVFLVRRDRELGTIKTRWYGLDRTGATPVHAALQALVDALSTGECLEISRGSYRVDVPLNITTSGIVVRGENPILHPNPGPENTLLTAAFAVASGVSATIASVTAHNPAKDSRGVVATLTGLSGISGVSPGDTLTIGGAAVERNNGSFTVMSVNSGAGSVTYFGYNSSPHLTSAEWRATATEANNGSLTWSIKRPMIQLYTRDVRLENLFIYGNSTVGAVVDSSITGTAGTPNGITVNTNNQLINCRLASGVDGIKIGDFSGYVSGGAAEIEWANNHDLHVVHGGSITSMSHAAIFCPNATSNSMQHSFTNVTLGATETGIYGRKIGFTTSDVNFTNCEECIHVEFIAQPIHVTGGGCELSPVFLNLGLAGYLARSDGSYPITVTGFRGYWNAADMPPDDCVIKTSQIGGLTLSGCIFFGVQSGVEDWTIGAFGLTYADQSRHVAMSILSCIFPCANPAKIVTAKTGTGGLFPVRYFSIDNTVMQGATNLPLSAPNGVIEAYGNPANSAGPSFSVPLVVVPPSAVTLTNGDNNNVANPWRSCVTVTGPTAQVNLNGIAAGEDGQIIDLDLSYEYDTVIAHLSASATGKKITTPTGASITLWAPDSGGFNRASFRYSATGDSGNGAWILRDYISGSGP